MDHPGLGAIDDVGAPRTQSGKPYTIFTPFHRNWEGQPRRAVAGCATRAAAAAFAPREGPDPVARDARPGAGGARAGKGRRVVWTQAARVFPQADVRSYGQGRDALGEDSTSRLSPYLHFGCVSARELETRLPGGDGAEAFRRQLCWRDFHHHVLLHFPRNAHAEFQERYRRKLAWSRAERHFEAWCEGRTGFPLVDAGMRQLRARGLDAQPRAARRRLVPDEGPRDRLALGRALVHAPAARRRRGEQQRQLAVDRVGRDRSCAGLPADLQPGAPARQLRPGWPLRAPLRARARACTAQAPRRAMDDGARAAARARLRDRRGLPRADRRPCRGAARGARALPRA